MERRSFTAAIGAGALLSMLSADGGLSHSLTGPSSQGKRCDSVSVLRLLLASR